MPVTTTSSTTDPDALVPGGIADTGSHEATP
jgi:hypothetical protein